MSKDHPLTFTAPAGTYTERDFTLADLSLLVAHLERDYRLPTGSIYSTLRTRQTIIARYTAAFLASLYTPWSPQGIAEILYITEDLEKGIIPMITATLNNTTSLYNERYLNYIKYLQNSVINLRVPYDDATSPHTC